MSDVLGGDPPGLPRMAGTRLVAHGFGHDDGLTRVEIVYLVDADIEQVRRHYRGVMREHGWTVGEVDVDDDGWDLRASQGAA